MLKKIFSIALVCLMLTSVIAFAESNEQIIKLGTSGLEMTVDSSYVEEEITSADTDESQVAYYKSDIYELDFDIYQWAIADGETLSSAAKAEAAEFDAEPVEVEFNGIPAFLYEAVEESEGVEYPTLTVMMQNGDFFAEVVFWLDGDFDAAYDAAETMMNSIVAVNAGEIVDEGKIIKLGTSSLTITSPYVYAKGEITEEDTDENQVAYYKSEETLVDFDVYQWAKAEGETLESVVNEEAAEYNAEAAQITVNDITLAFYNAVEENEGEEYNTVTYITEDGNDFIEIVFWLDGDDAAATVDAIINSITR